MANELEAAAELIQARAGAQPVEFAFLLGNGLSDGIDPLANEVALRYDELPGFPEMRTFGNEGKLCIGELEGVKVVCLKGRASLHDSGNPRAMALPLETIALLGAGAIIITGSCGSVDADIFPGSLVAITDHINMTGVNPLAGEAGGAISLSKAYDERLIGRIRRGATAAGVSMRDGVLMWYSGPTFATPAEAKMCRMIGGNVLGHTIAPEVILARRLGLRACAVGAITHFGAGFHNSDPSAVEARETGRQGAIALRRLFRAFVRAKEGAFAPEGKPSLLRKPIV